MSYRFVDGRPITPDNVPPMSPDMRLMALEQRIADLEAVVKWLAGGKPLPVSVAAKLAETP